jgi:hypothetical protein
MPDIYRKLIVLFILFLLPGLLEAQGVQKNKTLAINVIVPVSTADDDSVYLYSNLNTWDSGKGMPGLDSKNHDICGKKTGKKQFCFSIEIPANIDSIAYKFTKYDIYNAECLKNGAQKPLRIWHSKDGYSVTDTVQKWYDEVVSGFQADTIDAAAVVGYLNYKYFRQFNNRLDTLKLFSNYRAALKEANVYFNKYYKQNPKQLNALYYNTVFLAIGKIGHAFAPLLADLACQWEKNISELDKKILDRDVNSIDTLCLISEANSHIAQLLISCSADSAGYKTAIDAFSKYLTAARDKIYTLEKNEKYSAWLEKQDFDLKACNLNVALHKGKIEEAEKIFSSLSDSKRPEYYYFASRIADTYTLNKDTLSAYNTLLRSVNLESDFIVRIKLQLLMLGEKLKFDKVRINNDFNSKIFSDIASFTSAKKKFEFVKLYDLDGKECLPGDIKDKLKIMVFWSVQDEKGLRELAEFRKLKEHLKGKDIEIYAVCVDFATNGVYSKDIKKDFEGIDVNYKMLMDSGTKPMFKENGVKNCPVTFLVDDNSNILYQFEGYSEKKLVQLGLVIDTFL